VCHAVPDHNDGQPDHDDAGGHRDGVAPRAILVFAHQPLAVDQDQHESQHERQQDAVGHLRDQNDFQQRQAGNQHEARAADDQRV
jgi:hypothetical protein